MTDFRQISALPGGRAMVALLLLLVIGQMTALIQALLKRRRAGVLLLCGLHFALGAGLLMLVLADLPYHPTSVPGGFTGWMDALPWPLLLAAEALSAGGLIACFIGNQAYRRMHLTNAAIKETIDLLETGICFGTGEGAVLLTNVRMNAYCRLLTGHVLTDTRALWQRVQSAGESSEGQWLVPLPDGSRVLFGKTAVTLEGRACEQIIAADVTEQYRATEELKEKNRRLKDHQLRMKMLMAQTAALIPSQEILAARTAFHDQFGGLLLTGKYYFEHPGSADPDALLALTRQINSMFLEQVEQPDDMRSPYEDALRLCGRIGVQLRIRGSVPTQRRIQDVLGRAVAECAANAVKHADGHTLTLRCSREGRRLTAVFTNDGDAPAGPVRESGGLLSLRRLTENLGGRMLVESQPAFRLTLILPLDGEGRSERKEGAGSSVTSY
ncbi:MAG: hypothetical protein IJ662_12405 [Clostridia bacterium]|nr:hypothetical protein [Clostridia bacterium]